MGAISLFQGRVEVYSASLTGIQNFSFAGDPSQRDEFSALNTPQRDLCQRLHSTFPDADKVEMESGAEGKIVIHHEDGEDLSEKQLDDLRKAVAAYGLNDTEVAQVAFTKPDEGVLRRLAAGLKEL